MAAVEVVAEVMEGATKPFKLITWRTSIYENSFLKIRTIEKEISMLEPFESGITFTIFSPHVIRAKNGKTSANCLKRKNGKLISPA